MKTHKNLFGHIADFDNLWLAHRKARRGKRAKGAVARFELRLEAHLLQLQAELLAQAYRPGGYTTFYVRDTKRRMISAASYRDRVVHHALCNVIQPILEATFIADSFANREGKGTHAAIRRFQSFLQKNDYVLKCDIRKYFPSIDHRVLKQLVRRKIACRRTLWLIDLIIDNSNPQEAIDFPLPDPGPLAGPVRRGLPIGNLTSQYFANLYLNGLDHFVKEKLGAKCYIRYVDDFVLLHSDKAVLQGWKAQIETFLQTLGLVIHPTKSRIIPARCGVGFLGQRVYRTHRLLRSQNVRAFWRRLKKNLSEYKQNRLSSDKFEARLNSWKGHAQQADTHRLLRRVFFTVKAEGLHLVKSRRSAWRLLEQQTQ